MPLLETSPRPSSVSVQDRTVQRILLVDDELEVLASLTHLLAQAGYQVTAASSLAAALQALDRERFHLVLTDLFLGEDDLGYQVAERAHGLSPRVPVVLLTGRPSFDRALEAMR